RRCDPPRQGPPSDTDWKLPRLTGDRWRTKSRNRTARAGRSHHPRGLRLRLDDDVVLDHEHVDTRCVEDRQRILYRMRDRLAHDVEARVEHDGHASARMEPADQLVVPGVLVDGHGLQTSG